LWADLDALERNIAALASHFRRAGVAWRPHTKGIKVPAIVHKLLRAGAIGVTCAKVSEAEVMAASGIHDILIANEPPRPEPHHSGCGIQDVGARFRIAAHGGHRQPAQRRPLRRTRRRHARSAEHNVEYRRRR
jgi:hypothetical protein